MVVRALNGVGMVASRARTIRDGREFDGYFPQPTNSNPVLSYNAENEDTLEKFIPQVAAQYRADTEKIALVLKKKTIEDTCKAVWDFVYNHIQYKLDEPHEEQIRRPARSWSDRRTGVDCDCYSVFISSILQNLNIRHAIRMTAYNKQRGFQHVYIVVPKNSKSDLSKRADYLVLDCVMDAYNAEKPFIFKKDKIMGASGSLNGFPVRMLNGTEFSSRSNLVFNDVYYHPGMKTWALKGLDGGFYIRGDKNLRYVEPYATGLNGGFFKKLIKTAVKIVTPIAAGAANFFVPGSGKVISAISNGLTADKKSGAPSQPGQQAQPQTQLALPGAAQASSFQGSDNSGLENKIRTANNNTVQSLDTAKQVLQKAIQANNKAVVTSLDSVDKANKDRLDKFASSVNAVLSSVKEKASSTEEVTAVIQQISEKTAAISAGTQMINQKQTVIITDEAQKNENFRNQIQTWGKYILIAIAIVVAWVVYNKNKQPI